MRAYFFTAVRHNCAKVLKLKNRYNLQLEEEYIDEPVYSEEEFEGECRKLYAEIARLPEQCRKVFELIVLKDMKYKEVADFLGLSVNTVKTHFARALKQLRSSLQILLVFLTSEIAIGGIAEKAYGGQVIRKLPFRVNYFFEKNFISFTILIFFEL